MGFDYYRYWRQYCLGKGLTEKQWTILFLTGRITGKCNISLDNVAHAFWVGRTEIVSERQSGMDKLKLNTTVSVAYLSDVGERYDRKEVDPQNISEEEIQLVEKIRNKGKPKNGNRRLTDSEKGDKGNGD